MMFKNQRQQLPNQGFLLVVVLVFAAVFLTILTSFLTFIVTQSRLIEQRVEFEQAGQIAEAGLNYYKWYLAHHPNDTTNGTGLPGPYVGVYYDPEGGAIGEYSLSVASTTYCGEVSSINVTSVGYTYEMPDVRRTLSARYSLPNVAEFSFILNSDVWAGPDRVINGPYHSNGGVRMDGTHNSVVSSGQATWWCTSSFGCSPSGNRAGVFTTTANANTALFATSTTPVSFGGITTDLAVIKNRAQTGGGLYFASTTPTTEFGYHVQLNSNNTVTVRRVTGTTQYWGQTTEAGWQQERHVISSMGTASIHAINVNCPVLFFEDKIWLEGTVSGKVTIAAADVTSTTRNPQIILQDNILYASATSSGLLAIAEQDVLIGVDVPTDLYLNGIFIAQNGRYGRNFYCQSCGFYTGPWWNQTWNPRGLPDALDPYYIRNSENHNGTIVSNGRVGTQWTNGMVITSGFLNRYTSYDRNLVENPPPFIPNTSDVYEFSDWRDAN